MKVYIVNKDKKFNVPKMSTVYRTGSKEDVFGIIEKHKNVVHEIVSVGGDGTLNTIVASLVQQNLEQKVCIQVVNAGTGNDLYRMLSEDATYVDVAKVNDFHFVNISSLGLDAVIAKNMNEFRKFFIPKKLRYIVSGIYSFFHYKPIEAKIILNDETFDCNLAFIAVANGMYYGGGMKIAPESSLQDEMFSIVLVKHQAKHKLFFLFIKLLFGMKIVSGAIEYKKASEISIITTENILCNYDGEIFEDNTFNFHFESKIKMKK